MTLPSLPPIAETVTTTADEEEEEQTLAIPSPFDEIQDNDNNDEYHHVTAGILASPSSNNNQTPYQIFRNRNSFSKLAVKDDKKMYNDDENVTNGGSSMSIVPIDIDLHGDNENTETESDIAESTTTSSTPRNNKSSPYNGHTATTTSTNSNTDLPGFLSPNSIEIRKNALKLLEERPRRKKKVDKNRRRSMPLQPLSSLMNIQASASGTSMSKKGNLSKGTNNNASGSNATKLKDVELNIKQELEADFEEIKEVVTSMANMAHKASNDAYEALTYGARNIVGQLW